MIEYRVEPETRWVVRHLVDGKVVHSSFFVNEVEAREAPARFAQLAWRAGAGLPPDSPEVKMPGAWEDEACNACGRVVSDPADCPVGFPGCARGDV